MTTERGMVGFLSFRWLISPVVIRVVYVLGTIALTVWGIRTLGDAVDIAQELGGSRWARDTFLWGLAILVLGNLLWRILCEMFVVLFNIEEHLAAVREDLPYTLRAVERPLEELSRRFHEGARELTAIKEELREGVSFANLRETLASLAEQFEQGTAQFAAAEKALQEELSRSELQNALRTVAQRLEDNVERLARVEQELQERVSSPTGTAPAPSDSEPEREANNAVTLVRTVPRARRRVLQSAFLVLGVGLLGAVLFLGIPLATGYGELEGLDLQYLSDLFSDAWAYWKGLIQGMGT